MASGGHLSRSPGRTYVRIQLASTISDAIAVFQTRNRLLRRLLRAPPGDFSLSQGVLFVNPLILVLKNAHDWYFLDTEVQMSNHNAGRE